MPNRNKALGTALENRVVEKAQEHGLTAHRQPGSGMYEDFPHDGVVENLLVEAKVRSARLDAKGEKQLTISLDWLKAVEESAAEHGFEAGVVFVRPKNSARLLVLCDADFFLGLLAKDRALRHLVADVQEQLDVYGYNGGMDGMEMAAEALGKSPSQG